MAKEKAGAPGGAFRGAGVTLHTPSGHCLWVRRSADSESPHTWCGGGGGIEDGESARQAAAREIREELGYEIDPAALIPFHKYVDSKLHFFNFRYQVPEPFHPKLNKEHTGWCWALPNEAPEPRHYGVTSLLRQGLHESVCPAPKAPADAYGTCPECGALGASTERRSGPEARTTCANGHTRLRSEFLGGNGT